VAAAGSARTPGDRVYIVNARWLEKWREFVAGGAVVGLGAAACVPDRIDNLSLLQPGSLRDLRPGLREGDDYAVLAPAAWELLFQWYRGGPAITRKIVLINSVPDVEVPCCRAC
jgi:ubiquitin carboxyl-terminal hydrolase 4/11/15